MAGKRERRKRIYRLLREEGVSKKKSARAAKRLARSPGPKSSKNSRLSALGTKAKTIAAHRPTLHRSNP
jgi:hypothetical protein